MLRIQHLTRKVRKYIELFVWFLLHNVSLYYGRCGPASEMQICSNSIRTWRAANYLYGTIKPSALAIEMFYAVHNLHFRA
jgi:hypothetical protein